MGEKANFDSVTTEGCSCTYLQREAAEPSSPIQFDTEMQEYQLAHLSGGGHSMIYHCPWCGGVAPRSQRERISPSSRGKRYVGLKPSLATSEVRKRRCRSSVSPTRNATVE
jgi:hypothetical protein